MGERQTTKSTPRSLTGHSHPFLMAMTDSEYRTKFENFKPSCFTAHPLTMIS